MEERDPYALPAGTVISVKAEFLKQWAQKNPLPNLDSQKFSLDGVKQEWPDFFVLFRLNTGGHMAILDGRLSDKFLALTANVSEPVQLIMEALAELERLNLDSLKTLRQSIVNMRSPNALSIGKYIHIMKGSEEMPHTLERLVSLVINLKNAIGPSLHQMRWLRDGSHLKAAKNVTHSFSEAVEAWNRRTICPSKHGGAGEYSFTMANGVEIMAPLPWLAIEVARLFVETKLKLPKKQDLRLELEKRYPALKGKKGSFWADVYRNAGLSDLDRAEAYSHPRYERLRSAKSPEITEPLLASKNNLKTT